MMAEIWKPHPSKVYLQWIRTISEESLDDLNEWEHGFIVNVQQRLNVNLTLTEEQANKLEEIYVKYTS